MAGAAGDRSEDVGGDCWPFGGADAFTEYSSVFAELGWPGGLAGGELPVLDLPEAAAAPPPPSQLSMEPSEDPAPARSGDAGASSSSSGDGDGDGAAPAMIDDDDRKAAPAAEEAA